MGSSSDMQVGRHGIPAYEKINLVGPDGSRRDLSIVATELDAAFFSTAWWTALADLDATLLPPVPAPVRIASSLERPSVLALSQHHAGGHELLMLGAHALGGATDPLRLGATNARCISGLAAIAGPSAGDGTPAIGGYSAYLLICALQDDGRTPALASARLFLGPVIAAPTIDLPSAIRLGFGTPEAMRHHDVPLAADRPPQALSALAAGRNLPGAAVLLAPSAEHWVELGRRRDTAIRLDAGVLGVQLHSIAA